MYKLIVENEKGERLELTNSPYFDVLELDGIGSLEAQINTAELANVDGAMYSNSRIHSRNIVITLNIRYPIEENRIKLYKYFRVKRYVKLYYRNDHRDVYTEGYVETFENNLFKNLQQPQISIICPCPFWKSNSDNTVNFSVLSALFEFPFSIPAAGIEFSRINKITTTYINAGNVETGAVIRLHATGEVEDPVIFNRTTGEFFGITVTMTSGDEIVINTQQGEKSVKLTRGGTVTNLLASRTSGSSWLVFEPGENETGYSAESGQSSLDVTVTVVQKFEGV